VNRALSRAGAALGAAALAASSLLVSASSATAADPGTLVVSVVDQYGRPTAGVINPYDFQGIAQPEDGATTSPPFLVAPVHTFTLAPGGYSLVSLTPWSGVDCVALSPCSFASPPTQFGTAVTVTSGETTTYTFHVTVPTISGTGAVGSPVSVALPPRLTDLLTTLNMLPFGGGAVTQQWQRAGSDIPGATGASYVLQPGDASSSVAARLSPAQGQSFLFTPYGYTVPPFTTNAIPTGSFSPAKTKTKLRVAKRLRAGERATMTVRLKAASGVPEGEVTIRIGKFRTEKTVEGGRLLYTLPRLAAGTYKVSVKYAGSEFFARSKARAKITVTAG
jgi:hypothetical protein